MKSLLQQTSHSKPCLVFPCTPPVTGSCYPAAVSPMCSHWAHFVNSPQPQGSHGGGPRPITGHLWLWAASSVPFPMVSGTDVVSFCVSHTVNKVRRHCYVIRLKAITSGSSCGACIIPPLPPASALRFPTTVWISHFMGQMVKSIL